MTGRSVAAVAATTLLVVAGCGGGDKKASDFKPTAAQKASFIGIERSGGGFIGKNGSVGQLVGMAESTCALIADKGYATTHTDILKDIQAAKLPYKPVDAQTLIFSAVRQICPAYLKKLPA